MGRIKRWHPKTFTGCKTCRARRIKCDERKPHCDQCAKSNRFCEGYDNTQKVWMFEPHPAKFETNARSSHWSSSENSSAGNENESQSARSGSRSSRTGPARRRLAPSIYQHGLIPLHSLPGPYQRQQEQFFFKFFVEVAMTTYMSRSRVGEAFWRIYFPQVAWHLEGARYALLSMAMLSQQRIQDIFLGVPQVPIQQEILEYESRAIKSVVREASSLEGILITSMAFWAIALLYGDYAQTLQHAYFCQRIIQANIAVQTNDCPSLQYPKVLSRAALEYFRATRGPCSLHHSTSIDTTLCSALCFIPEEYPLYVRVADTLHHLREALLSMTTCKYLLTIFDNNVDQHSYHSNIISLLENALRKIKFLIHRWSDHKHLDIPSKTFERDAQNFISIPYTTSPFRPVLAKIHQAIKLHSVSTAALFSAAVFSEVEHLMHHVSIMPNICLSTSRSHPKMLRDFGLLMFLGSKAHADLELQEDFKGSLVMESGWTTEEETRLWRELVRSAEETRMVQTG